MGGEGGVDGRGRERRGVDGRGGEGSGWEREGKKGSGQKVREWEGRGGEGMGRGGSGGTSYCNLKDKDTVGLYRLAISCNINRSTELYILATMIFCASPATTDVESSRLLIFSINGSQVLGDARYLISQSAKDKKYNGSLHISHETHYKTSLHTHYLPAVTAGIGEVVEKEGVLFTVFSEGVAGSGVSRIGRQRGNGDGEGEGLRGSIPIHSSKVWHPLSTELRGEQILVAVQESVDAPFP